MEKRRTILVFSGYNQRAVIAFLRTLKANNIENYIIAAIAEDDDILKTEYKDKVGIIRNSADLNIEVFSFILNRIRREAGERFFIIPSSEYLNRFLLKERKAIEDMNCEIPLVSKELYERISDKSSFNRLCRENNINTPIQMAFPFRYSAPFVAKPKSYFSKKGQVFTPVIVQNGEDYRKFEESYRLEDFYYESFVEGRNYYLLYYFGEDGRVFQFSQENMAQQPHGKSVVAARAADIHRGEISQKFQKLFRSVGFHGLVMVEIRKCCDGCFYMIEANPRLWGPSQLFVDAGCNFFEAFLKDYGFLKKDIVFKEEQSWYFWNGGIGQTWSKREQIAFFAEGEELLFQRYSDWIKADIYRKADTRQLFMSGK